jgi:hypothetical protein
MKQLMVILLVFLSLAGYGQQQFPAFKPLRYNEDYLPLKKDTSTSWYKSMKYIPLSPAGNTFISLGGEIRYRYFGIRNENWGAAPTDKDGYTQSRVLAHADFHAGDNLRFFGQLQGGMTNGKASGNSPVDENPLDLHQAFVDLKSNSENVLLRLGRQELSYGSQRLISVRELPNNRQAFDGAKIILSRGQYQLDAFYSRYVTAREKIFDDLSNKGVNLWGAYLVRNEAAILKNLDLYYLGLSRDQATFNDGKGQERRHSIGSRIWGEINDWQYDFEGVYQFGDFAGKSISAWTLSSNTAYTFSNTRFRPVVRLKTELISGDAEQGDHKLQTFNPMFPKGAYFGLAALIGPSNLFDLHPSIALELIRDKLVWTTDYDAFWRHSADDGIYETNVTLIFPAGTIRDKFIGHQLATDFTYTPNEFLDFRGEFTWFKAEGYLEGVSPGRNILFFGVTSQFKF